MKIYISTIMRAGSLFVLLVAGVANIQAMMDMDYGAMQAEYNRSFGEQSSYHPLYASGATSDIKARLSTAIAHDDAQEVAQIMIALSMTNDQKTIKQALERIMANNNIALLAALLDCNAVDLEENSVFPLLHMAAEQGSIPVVDFLLTRKADLNWADFDGMTPLMVAAQAGQALMVTFLLEKGADIAVRRRGLDVYHYAKHGSNPSAVVKALNQYRKNVSAHVYDAAQLPADIAEIIGDQIGGEPE